MLILALDIIHGYAKLMIEPSQRPDAYVGISGVVSAEQQTEIEQYAETIELNTRRLMLGVKAVHKTQFLDIENKYGPAWYPVGEAAFTSALRSRGSRDGSLAIAQTYLDPDLVENPGYRFFFMNRLLQRGAPWIDGIQFDMLPWHTHPEMLDFLEELKERTATKILLQVHRPAMNTLSPEGVAGILGEYRDTLDYVLFDSSHGTGKRLDTSALIEYLSAVYESPELTNTGFALAGGLNRDTVLEELPKVLEKFPDISWDAEGQLHPATATNERPLDMKIVSGYLKAAKEVSDKLGYNGRTTSEP